MGIPSSFIDRRCSTATRPPSKSGHSDVLIRMLSPRVFISTRSCEERGGPADTGSATTQANASFIMMSVQVTAHAVFGFSSTRQDDAACSVSKLAPAQEISALNPARPLAGRMTGCNDALDRYVGGNPRLNVDLDVDGRRCGAALGADENAGGESVRGGRICRLRCMNRVRPASALRMLARPPDLCAMTRLDPCAPPTRPAKTRA